MDIPDVSNVVEYLQILAKLKESLQAASKRKGQVPTDHKPRDQVISDHTGTMTSSSMMEQMNLRGRELLINSVFLPPPYLPSVTPLKDLKKILIKDMRLETHHRGFYVLLRAVTRSHRTTAVMTVVEDENSDAVPLQLYQQEHEDVRPAVDIFRQSEVCIVKEPYFKVTSNGACALRVDHIGDIVWLRVEDDRVPLPWLPRIIELDKTAEDWKQEGNSSFVKGNFRGAVEEYTLALQASTSSEEIDIIKLNRSVAYLKLGRYDEALLDTERIPADAMSENGLFRAALAYYRLQKYQDCRKTLDRLLQKYPANAMARKELSEVQIRLREQSRGEYDFKSMYEATKIMPLSFDNATYLGPAEIKASIGRGRGLFTTRAVKVGELLLCEKAFSHCYTDEKGEFSSRINLLMDAETNRMTVGTSSYLTTQIVQQLQRNPSQIPSYLSLHHGSYQQALTKEVDGQPVIDTFLVARIEALNAFGCPLTSLDIHFGDSKKATGSKTVYLSAGIWIHASHINHSCYSNAHRSFIGDMQIVRATRDIPENTELVFKYNEPDLRGYKEHQAKLQHWGFECTCAICVDWKHTPRQRLKKRNDLLGDLKAAFPASGVPDTSKAERLLAALEKTYKQPSTAVPRLALPDSYCVLLQIYVAQNRPEKVLVFVRKLLNSLGFVVSNETVPGAANLTSPLFVVEQWGLMVDRVVEAFLSLWVVYAIVAPELAIMAEGYAKTAYKICVGEDDTFDTVVGAQAREAVARGVCYWSP